eukprot:9028357-Lingulodinium_polyedra.AAC.1
MRRPDPPLRCPLQEGVDVLEDRHSRPAEPEEVDCMAHPHLHVRRLPRAAAHERLRGQVEPPHPPGLLEDEPTLAVDEGPQRIELEDAP